METPARQVKRTMKGPGLALWLGMAWLAFAPSACQGQQPGSARPAAAPVEVGVLTLAPETVLLTTELPGRTAAFETFEVRPQVSGVIRARLFTEGQLVERGQTLYQIDAR